MSNVTRSMLLMTAIVLIGFMFAAQSKSQIPAQPNTLRWEYHITPGVGEITRQELNHLGSEGWELVAVLKLQDHNSAVNAVFKRRK